MRIEHNLPTEVDYTGAIEALQRLQDTYLLNSTDIRKGIIGKYHSFRHLDGFYIN